jgi:flagellar operon protein
MIDVRRIQGPPPIQPEGQTEKVKPGKPGEFAQALEKARTTQKQLHFSAHAQERMAQRGIELTPIDMSKFENAVDTAAEKGARNSLVLLDEHAFVVSVANRTVITALDSESMKDQVVTDIDSAVII